MSNVFSTRVKFDLLKVGHCSHPECAVLRGGRLNAVEFPALVGLIEHPQHGLLLYDTGYSRHFWDATGGFPECLYRRLTPPTLAPEEELVAQLAGRGIRPGDIGTIVISHFHADHVAGLRDFPQARFLATRPERELCERLGRLGRLRRAYLRALLPEDLAARLSYVESTPRRPLPPHWQPFPEGYDLLGDGSLLGLDLPGHAASQLGLGFADAAGREHFLVADACWKIEGLAQRRLPSRVAYVVFDNGAAYDTTFAQLCQLQASPQAPEMIPSHCLTTWQRLGGTRHVVRA
ncbi:MAG: MBL fold metallo-hydrolase [Verrucomicrobia bacterium]|nr:MBL fold metallo-hydrolase [Verrucomicrobiota bacterium]